MTGHPRRQLSAIRIGLEYPILLVRLKRRNIRHWKASTTFPCCNFLPPDSWHLPNNCPEKNMQVKHHWHLKPLPVKIKMFVERFWRNSNPPPATKQKQIYQLWIPQISMEQRGLHFTGVGGSTPHVEQLRRAEVGVNPWKSTRTCTDCNPIWREIPKLLAVNISYSLFFSPHGFWMVQVK